MAFIVGLNQLIPPLDVFYFYILLSILIGIQDRCCEVCFCWYYHYYFHRCCPCWKGCWWLFVSCKQKDLDSNNKKWVKGLLLANFIAQCLHFISLYFCLFIKKIFVKFKCRAWLVVVVRNVTGSDYTAKIFIILILLLLMFMWGCSEKHKICWKF